MSIDLLQNRIRKLKNPSVIDFSIEPGVLPPHLLEQEGSEEKAYLRFCRELMGTLKDFVPAVRFSFGTFALMGREGLCDLSNLLIEARELGYYVLLDATEIYSPWDAKRVAKIFMNTNGDYYCDGLIISPYIGSDSIKPFLPGCQESERDLFVIVRSPNKSAAELQDLLTGSRQVHLATMELVNRSGERINGKSGYSRIGALVSATSADSLRNLRMRYPYVFHLVDGLDYPSGNAKICANAFDRLGHGAVVCAGPSVTSAWKEAESDGSDYLELAYAAAERMKKNLTRYVTIL